MALAPRKRYRGGYVEDPGLGHSVDVSNVGADILNDPLKLLDWLSSNEGSSDGISPESRPVNSANVLPGCSAFEVRRSFCAHDEGAQSLAENEIGSAESAHVQDRSANVYSTNWELSYLGSRGIEYVDNRAKGGPLWVVGDYSIAVEIGYLRSCGMVFHFKEEGGSASNHKPAWWTKSATPMPPAALTEVDASCRGSLDTSPVDNVLGSATHGREAADSFASSELAPLAVPELLGILIGITCDGRINELEAKTLLGWLESVDEEKCGNFSKVKRLLERYLADDVIDEDEEKALLSLFQRIMDLAKELDADAPSKNASTKTSSSLADEEVSPVGKARPEVEAIRKLGCKCIDLRDEGGALWVLGGSWVKNDIATLRRMGLRFSFSANGSVATGFAPGWWTRDEFANESESASEVEGVAPVSGFSLRFDGEKVGDYCEQGVSERRGESQDPVKVKELAAGSARDEKPAYFGRKANAGGDQVALCNESLPCEGESLETKAEQDDSANSFGRDAKPKNVRKYRNIRLTVTDRFSRTHTISSNNVLFMKANGEYTTIFTCDSQVIEARCGLHSMEMKLQGEGFVRPNRSYLVSINQVESIEEQENGRFCIYMKGRNEGIPVRLSRMSMINYYFDPDVIIYQ